MWKPTVRITDEELEKRIKDKLESEGKSVQEIIVNFLTKYANSEAEPEQEQTSKPLLSANDHLMKGLPEGTKRPEEFKYHTDWVDYLEREGLAHLED